MCDSFPCRSWPYHSLPDGQWGILYSSSRSFGPFRRSGHMLAVGIMVPKMTSVMVPKVISVRQFRVNSSLYISGPMARAQSLRSSFSCISIP
ncbi:hypothetical protein BRARA_G01312, partial [Brassica rapa]